MVENLKQNGSAVAEDLIPNVISVGYLQKVLGALLREGIPIKDMETILETLGDHISTLKDIDITTEYVRQALKRTITRRFAEGNSLRVITLDPRLEDLIINSVKKSEQGSYLQLDPADIQTIVNKTTEQIDKIKDVISSVVVLTSPVVRIYYKRLIDQFIPGVVVLSYSEIDSNVQIQSIGSINL
jgi:flagellar biosynthesis protein FlhA